LNQKIQAVFLDYTCIFAQIFGMDMRQTYIERAIEPLIKQRLFGEPNKIVIIYGQRQVGKTTLVNRILQSQSSLKTLSVNADVEPNLRTFERRNLEQLRLVLEGFDVLFIDEAQRIADVGINLKIIHDHFPKLRVIVTGSSSFELANKIQEPLTGRTWSFLLHPLSASELVATSNALEYSAKLEEWLIYGQYPGVFQLPQANDKRAFLIELTRAYLYKDLLDLAQIKHSRKLHDCLQLVALQLGQEVSLHELGKQLHLDASTVARYLDLLEKCFIIKAFRGFSRNERKEITKKQKIYFYDLGIRNALIERFTPLHLRNDNGSLWENFLIMERHKLLSNNEIWARQHFWRLQSGAEIDYVESADTHLAAFEFKFNKTIEAKAPASWVTTYPEAQFSTIHTDNWLPFVLGKPPYQATQ
jgi:uncharacterized protein